MVIFKDPDDANKASEAIASLRKTLQIKPEFKFNKCKNDHRDRFFDEIAKYDFTTRAVVVQKELIYSTGLRTAKESFYKFFIRMMMQNDGNVLKDAKVVIDGSGDRPFKRQFKSYLRRHIDETCVRKWDLKDSVRDPLIQLADMAAGCIARSYRTDRQTPDAWRKKLHQNGQLQNVWEFR